MILSDVITDTLLASLVTAVGTVLVGYFVLKSKGLFKKEQKLALDASTMEKYDNLMNQQLEREEELRGQLIENERTFKATIAEMKIQHAKEMAAQAERIQNLELAVHGDYLLTIQFATQPDPLVRNATIKLIGRKSDAEDPTTPA